MGDCQKWETINWNRSKLFFLFSDVPTRLQGPVGKCLKELVRSGLWSDIYLLFKLFIST